MFSSSWRRSSRRAHTGSSTKVQIYKWQTSPRGRAVKSEFRWNQAFCFPRTCWAQRFRNLLSQTGTTGRQFAHLLIRSYQEAHHNDFPDLERSAEDVGERRFPLKLDDLHRLFKRHGLKIHWFNRDPIPARNHGRQFKTMIRSFFESPNNVYINEGLQKDTARLKYELALSLGHKVLHDGDGLKSVHATGGQLGGTPETGARTAGGMNSRDVLFAWRDFECGFFAEALLCPKQAFRRFLMREQYRMDARQKLELTPAVYMRRMTAASPYPYWHYFDAYPPGYLRSVYRGNGIPLPWGNMAMVTDPCPRWAVFFMLRKGERQAPSSQISVLQDGDRSLLYCCHSLRTMDSAGNPHVLSVGVDLTPPWNRRDSIPTAWYRRLPMHVRKEADRACHQSLPGRPSRRPAGYSTLSGFRSCRQTRQHHLPEKHELPSSRAMRGPAGRIADRGDQRRP